MNRIGVVDVLNPGFSIASFGHKQTQKFAPIRTDLKMQTSWMSRANCLSLLYVVNRR